MTLELIKDQNVIDAEVIIEHLRVRARNGELLPKGGATQAIIVLDDGAIFKAISRCSQRDNFSRKLGRTIALGRALKKAELAGYSKVMP